MDPSSATGRLIPVEYEIYQGYNADHIDAADPSKILMQHLDTAVRLAHPESGCIPMGFDFAVETPKTIGTVSSVIQASPPTHLDEIFPTSMAEPSSLSIPNAEELCPYAAPYVLDHPNMSLTLCILTGPGGV